MPDIIRCPHCERQLRVPDDLIGKTWEALYDMGEWQRFKFDIMPALWKTGQWHGDSLVADKPGSSPADGRNSHHHVLDFVLADERTRDAGWPDPHHAHQRLAGYL